MKTVKFAVAFLILLSLVSVLLGGCATRSSTPSAPADPRRIYGDIVVRVNSFAASDSAIKGKSYFITSAIQGVNDSDLQFLEVAKYVENALSLSGYIRVVEGEKNTADQVMRLAYGIGTPQTSTQTQTISSGYSYPVGSMWFTVPPKTATTTSTTYMRTLILEAYEQKGQSKQAQLWKTTLQSEGETSDLRQVLAYMIAASSSYFGTDTRRQITATIQGSDSRVLHIWK